MEIGVVKEQMVFIRDSIVGCHLHLADSTIDGRLDHREPLFEGQGFGMDLGW